MPAWAIGGGEFRSALAEHGFTDIRRYPLGFFSGLAESPNLWAVDWRLARAFPGLAHTTDWVATRCQSR